MGDVMRVWYAKEARRAGHSDDTGELGLGDTGYGREVLHGYASLEGDAGEDLEFPEPLDAGEKLSLSLVG